MHLKLRLQRQNVSDASSSQIELDPDLRLLAHQYVCSLFEGDALYHPTRMIYTQMISGFGIIDVNIAVQEAVNIAKMLNIPDKRKAR